MNGVHDLGGMDGFGPVEVEADEPVFHASWERTVFGISAAWVLARLGNGHEFRHAIERMDPVHYLRSSYYEHWLTGLATLLVEKGLLTREALEERAGGAVPLSRAAGGGAAPTGARVATPRFALGAAVRVRNLNPLGHTRCPRYVRGKRGVVVRVDHASPLPDAAAHAGRPCDEAAYGVRFEARALWGEQAGAREAVHVDLWESYLEKGGRR
jgi:nitrile hydratase beta subunit